MTARLLQAAKWLARFVWRVVYATVNAIYKMITRAALYLATAALLVHFTLNSTAFGDELMTLLSEVLPGSFEAGTLQWGPWPSRVTLLDVDIRDPAGRSVVRVDRLTTSVALLRLQAFVVKKLVGANPALELVFEEVKLDGADVLVEVADDGWVGIAAAFSDVTKPRLGPIGPPPLIEINDIVLRDARVVVETPRVYVEGGGLHALARVVVTDKVVVTTDRLSSTEGRVVVQDAGADGALEIPWRNLSTNAAAWQHGLLVIPSADLIASRTKTRVRGTLETRGKVAVNGTARLLGVTHEEPLVSQWLPDDLLEFEGDVSVTAAGPFDWPHAAAHLDARTLVADGLVLGPIELGVGLEGNGRMRTATLTPLALDPGGGALFVDRAQLFVPDHGVTDQRFEVDLRLEEVIPQRLWDLGILTGDVPPPADSAVSGQVTAVVELNRDGAAASTWDVDANVEVNAEWERRADLPIGSFVGAFGRVRGQFGSDHSEVSVEDLTVWSDDDVAEVAGRMDLEREALDFGVDATLDTEALLTSFDVDDVAKCEARLAGAHVTGTWTSPNVIGGLSAETCRVVDHPLTNVKVGVALVDGTLRLPKVSARTEYGTVRLGAKLSLWDGDFDHISEELPLELTDVHASGIQLQKLELSDLRGTATVKSPKFSLKLGVDDLALQGPADVEVRGMAVGGEAFHHFRARVAAEGRTIRVKSLDARSTAGTKIAAKGRYHLDTERFDAEVSATDFDLEKAGILQPYKLPMRGTVDLTAKAEGVPASFSLNGKVTTEEFGWGGIHLGNATINFWRGKGKRKVKLTSPRFFQRAKMKEGSLELDNRGIPTRLDVTAAVRDLDVLRVLPTLRDIFPVLITKAGDVRFEAPFTGNRPTRLSWDIPDRAATAKVFLDLPEMTNVGRHKASLLGYTLEIERLVAQWAGQKFAACGVLELEKDTLSVDAATTLDLSQLPDHFPALRKHVADPAGRITTWAADANPLAPFDGSCLSSVANISKSLGNPEGVLKLRDALLAPTLKGGLRFEEVSMIPRSLGREITIEDGCCSCSPAAAARARR